MKKIKITTNKGIVFDWFLNLYLNFGLWINGIWDDQDKAVEYIARQLKKINKMKG